MEKPNVIRLQKTGVAQQSLTSEREALVVDLVSACLDQPMLGDAATVLVNRLATAFGCERVSIGFNEKHHVSVYTLSGKHPFDGRTQLVRKIESAMNECCDQYTVIALPDNPQGAVICKAHQILAQEHGQHAVISLPLTHQQQVIGVLTLEGSSNEVFAAETKQVCHLLCQLVGPVLDLKRHGEMSMPKRLQLSLRQQVQSLVGQGYMKKKVVVGLLLALLLAPLFVTTTFRITTEAVLEGSVQRAITSPVDSYLAAINARPGDEVQEGQVLGTLEDRDLSLERVKSQSQHDQLAREYREALAKHDRIQINILRTKMAQTSAQVGLLESQLQRLQVTAPFNGIIIEGDLENKLGSPIERGQVLFKIAPLDGYRIIFKVDESDINYIQAGQSGRLILTSLPDTELALRINKIIPVSVAKDGKNYFRVEAALLQPNAELRPGMVGVGKIDIDNRSLAWLALHRLLDRITLWLWKVSP